MATTKIAAVSAPAATAVPLSDPTHPNHAAFWLSFLNVVTILAQVAAPAAAPFVSAGTVTKIQNEAQILAELNTALQGTK